MKTTIAVATVIAVAIIIGALLVGGIYSVNYAGPGGGLYVTNRFTGHSSFCTVNNGCFEMNEPRASSVSQSASPTTDRWPGTKIEKPPNSP